MRKTFIIAALLLVTSCGYEHKPIFMRFGGDQLPEGFSVDYKNGWHDGCKTGEAVYGNHFTKAFRDFTRDASMVGNAAYERAWFDAYHFCRQSHNTTINNWEEDWWGLLTLQ